MNFFSHFPTEQNAARNAALSYASFVVNNLYPGGVAAKSDFVPELARMPGKRRTTLKNKHIIIHLTHVAVAKL
jgi:hypothetical protein